MPWLVDASNLGGALAGRAGSRDARGVVELLLPWARRRGRVVLVFDGPPRSDVADAYGGLTVRWSGARTADDCIVETVEKAPRPREWTVVTRDRELARRCRNAGARVEAPTTLVERTTRKRRVPRREGSEKPRPDAQDAAHWRKVFLGEE